MEALSFAMWQFNLFYVIGVSMYQELHVLYATAAPKLWYICVSCKTAEIALNYLCAGSERTCKVCTFCSSE